MYPVYGVSEVPGTFTPPPTRETNYQALRTISKRPAMD
jgi:hypothetical protein